MLLFKPCKRLNSSSDYNGETVLVKPKQRIITANHLILVKPSNGVFFLKTE
jgi:hypothetical protein